MSQTRPAHCAPHILPALSIHNPSRKFGRSPRGLRIWKMYVILTPICDQNLTLKDSYFHPCTIFQNWVYINNVLTDRSMYAGIQQYSTLATVAAPLSPYGPSSPAHFISREKIHQVVVRSPRGLGIRKMCVFFNFNFDSLFDIETHSSASTSCHFHLYGIASHTTDSKP